NHLFCNPSVLRVLGCAAKASVKIRLFRPQQCARTSECGLICNGAQKLIRPGLNSKQLTNVRTLTLSLVSRGNGGKMFVNKRNRRFRERIVLATIMMLLSSMLVRAQETTVLSGTVTDPQGKVIGDASVTITNTATNTSRSTKTGEDGAYVFNQVQPGT